MDKDRMSTVMHSTNRQTTIASRASFHVRPVTSTGLSAAVAEEALPLYEITPGRR